MMNQNRSTSHAALFDRLARYRRQAVRLQESAQVAMQRGQWNQAEELLWGSLVAAARGVALWYGESADTDAALRDFLRRLGEQERDRHIRDAFDHLAAVSEAAERVRERRSRVDYLFMAMDELSDAIDKLVAHLPGEAPLADPDDAVADRGR